jgi:hypothetical protein
MKKYVEGQDNGSLYTLEVGGYIDSITKITRKIFVIITYIYLNVEDI